MPANLLSGDHQKRCIEGTKFLSSLDPDWNLLISSVGPCKLNLSMELEPYQALIKSVIFQQLRPASASAIFRGPSSVIFSKRCASYIFFIGILD